MENKKNVLIEYLYLDLDTCDRCIGADKVLEEAIECITPDEVPPKAMLVEQILQKIFAPGNICCENEYTIPDNLARFYDGKEKKSSCCCCSSCC